MSRRESRVFRVLLVFSYGNLCFHCAFAAHLRRCAVATFGHLRLVNSLRLSARALSCLQLQRKIRYVWALRWIRGAFAAILSCSKQYKNLRRRALARRFAYFRGGCRKLLIIFTNLYAFIMTFTGNYVIMSLSVRKKRKQNGKEVYKRC